MVETLKKCPVLGVDYSAGRADDAVGCILENIKALSGSYICFSNVHTTVMAADDENYRKVLNGAAYVFPDGFPVAKEQRKKGFPDAERIAGPDFMEKVFERTSDGSLSHFFYGSDEETLKSLERKLRERYPGIRIKGTCSPPFVKELSREEFERDIERINEAGADLVWIGLGAPKQELWMNRAKNKVKGVMLGVGAGFSFHAGTTKRAPGFLQRMGLEWFYRLLKDPKRLFKRYLVTNTKFLWYTGVLKR